MNITRKAILDIVVATIRPEYTYRILGPTVVDGYGIELSRSANGHEYALKQWTGRLDSPYLTKKAIKNSINGIMELIERGIEADKGN